MSQRNAAAATRSDLADEAGERSRRNAIREGAFAALMQGGGENYLSAFAVLLNASAWQIGLLAALPQVVGTWSQLLSLKILSRFSNRKALMLAGMLGQITCWLPLLLLPLFFPRHAAWIVIVSAVGYFAFGHLTTPAWTSLLTDLVDPNGRGFYFARRGRVMAIASFTALCAGGLVLHWTKLWEVPWVGFAVIFLAVALARAYSVRYVVRIEEPSAPPTGAAQIRILDFLKHEGSTNFRKFLWFSGLMHAATLIAAPFFVIYFLRDLHFTYLQYAAWMATGLLGQLVTLKPWGLLGDQFGNKKVIMVTGLLVPFLPMLYLVSTNFWFVIFINFFGGIVWSGLALGLQNYVFDAVQPNDRPKGVALYNTVNAGGWFVGSLLGGWLAGMIPTHVKAGSFELDVLSNLQLVFFISGILRLGVSLSLLRTFGETRSVVPITHRHLVRELPLVKPLARALGTAGAEQKR
jgi:MFS family permease